MTGAVLKAMGSGVGGSLVTAAFLTTFTAVNHIMPILPLVIAFNGALTGFNLVRISGKRVSCPALFSTLTGAGTGLLTLIAVWFSVEWVYGMTLNRAADLVIYPAVSGVTGYLGATLAVRYDKL